MKNPSELLHRHILAFLLMAVLCLPVNADSAEPAGPLSLSDCISTALSHSTAILTAENDVVAAKSRSTSAKSSYLPQMSVQNNTFVWGSGGVLNKSTTGTAFAVTQNIWDGGLREAGVRRANHGVTQSTAGLSRTQQSVVFNVSKAYYEALRARHLAAVSQSNVTYSEGLRDQVAARAEEGEAAGIDVLPVEAQLASARVSLLSAQNSVRTSIIQLQNLMGLESQPGFDVLDVSDEDTLPIESLDDYIAAAVQSRPDILESKAATGASAASVKSARIALYPRPNISADYQRQIQGGFTSSSSQMVGSIVFDVFNGNANRAAYKEARANQSSAQLQEQQVLRDIRAQVEEAYLNLINTKQRITASDASFEAAQSNYEAQQERYSLGLGTVLDMLNAEVQVITAQSDVVQARYDNYTAISQMEYAVGRQRGAK